MLRASAKIEGAGAVRLALKDEGRRRTANVLRGMVRAAEWLLDKSQQIVPIDIGNLKASGKVEVATIGRRKEVMVVYEEEYAIYVHEDLEAQHAAGKQAKYLETPYRQGIQTMGRIVAYEVARKK